jgi:hypothetical protein
VRSKIFQDQRSAGHREIKKREYLPQAHSQRLIKIALTP